MHLCITIAPKMLQQISWSSYFIFLGLGTVVYYGCWLVRFFPGLPSRRPGATSLKNQIHSNPQTAPSTPATTEDAISTVTTTTTVTTTEPAIPNPQLSLLLPSPIENPILLPTLAADLVLAIKNLLEKGRSAALTEPEIIESLHQLLTSDTYRKLHSTPYEEKINDLLLREWENYGSAPLDREVITGLWQV
jgi:hypothetical protein